MLGRRRQAERALTTVVATCYLLGVSTRRMEKLVETLGITRPSKSQVEQGQGLGLVQPQVVVIEGADAVLAGHTA